MRFVRFSVSNRSRFGFGVWRLADFRVVDVLSLGQTWRGKMIFCDVRKMHNRSGQKEERDLNPPFNLPTFSGQHAPRLGRILIYLCR